MRRTFLILLAPALLLCTPLATATPWAPARAASPPTTKAAGKLAKARRQFQHDLISILALRAETRPLLGAALLARPLDQNDNPLDFHHLITRAAATPDAGAAVTWARLSDCDAAAMTCPNTKALKKLQKQDPDNAAVWLLTLGKAMHDGDHDRADAALAKAAQAKRYDDYTGRSLQALAYAVSALPPPKNTLSGQGTHATQVAALRVMMVFGIGHAQPVPGFHMAAKRCSSDAVGDNDALRKRCLGLAKVLVWGSSPLARSLGLHLRSTLSQTSGPREQADEAMRNLIWQVQHFAQLNARARKDRDVADRLLSLARKGGNQMSLMLAALRAFKIPVDAPDGWQPKHAQTPPHASS